ncbi:type II toxin-antitoxin system VapC family toxin [uncultured Thiodictyon sp.]|jgi:hypothetical protein|uniref:type II toxin-antitoxin system VapC family toxin n=1 Tax=uncultured Thiodictyon sp. TaxID=1846217 RepID=UPI0025E2C723|nr:type II toxin-antitoxin system VapC family toxin [uncultured Thiodictyon sp.]
MALLVDTCGWIEWLTDDTLAESFQPYLENIDRLVVPTAIQFELYKWVCRERDSEQALRVIALTEQGRVIPLSLRPDGACAPSGTFSAPRSL